ncbi:MAG: PEP-CTERM sorting domain-containing protein [Candidatus Eremiobacteraeota bacterium]|nr:PEP-CTERM sorting domain-containing protein [Candidatus Eremiobacteraeota bacterium]
MTYHPRFLAAVALTASALLPAAATAQTNLALGKSAFASSVYVPGMTDPGKAVDGITDGNYHNPASIFHSGNPPRQWWYVDLGASYDISSIVFYNRTDSFGERIIGSTLGIFTVTPYTMSAAAPVQSFTFTSADAMQTFTPAAGTRTGRYVGIYNPSDYLQIAELQVFGGAPTVPSTVPEPSTWVLLASGLGAVGVAGWRRRRTADG